MTQLPDEVVLLSDDGTPVGTTPRATVHHEQTPLHLAFSCYLLDDAGRVLLTRRALVKRAWPGVWTNAFCGHPRPGEAFETAIHRYARHELGTTVTGVRPLLPDFRYRAVDASGVVENEICPVYVARVDGAVEPNPDEVMDHRWIDVAEMFDAVDTAPWALSPWMVDQVGRLVAEDLVGAARSAG